MSGEQRLHQIVGYQLAQATIVTQAVFERSVGTPHALRPVEFTILMLVKENPGSSPARLSKALAVTRPNISVLIDKLQARGLVARERSASDGRALHLRVTAKGAALLAKAMRKVVENERLAFTTLSAVEQMMLTELLHKLACARGQARE